MSETVKPFDAGRWFPIHNAVFDVIMPEISPNAWKILCVAIRHTWGWKANRNGDPKERKQWDHIPYSQFKAASGISSYATVKRALDECLERGFLLRRQPLDADGNPQMVRGKPYFEYALNRDYELTTTETVAVKSGTTTETVAVESGTTTETVAETTTETVVPKQSSKQKHQQTDSAAADLSDGEAKRAFEALLDIGFTPRADAKSYAQEKPKLVLGWAQYAKEHQLGGGFVRKRLDAGEEPPRASVKSPPIPEGTRVYQ